MKAGTTYKVNHRRKGNFVMFVNSVDDTWASGYIVEGKTKAMCEYNVKELGEEVTVRQAFCTFEEVDTKGAE